MPIDRPVHDTEIRVVDAGLEPVPAWATGELLIPGAGPARGYRHAPEQTKERFIDLDDGTRAYRTGDGVRCLDEGSTEFLGLLDQQLKISGHWVESTEIEAALRLHPAVVRAVVAPVRDMMGRQVLAAFVVPATAAAPSVRDPRVHLGELLPQHMVPSSLEIVSELPFTLRGKLDRGALTHRSHGDPAPAEGRVRGFGPRHYATGRR
jgi:acyl-coenzyme A synthetase/AMP-(fatty) acid ligase